MILLRVFGGAARTPRLAAPLERFNKDLRGLTMNDKIPGETFVDARRFSNRVSERTVSSRKRRTFPSMEDFERRLDRKQAAGFLTERGYRTAPATLAKLPSVWAGPAFH